MGSILFVVGMFLTMWLIGQGIKKIRESRAKATANAKAAKILDANKQKERRTAMGYGIGNYGYCDDDFYAMREMQRIQQEDLDRVNRECNQRMQEEFNRFTDPYDSTCGYSFFNDCSNNFGGGCGCDFGGGFGGGFGF